MSISNNLYFSKTSQSNAIGEGRELARAIEQDSTACGERQ